MLPRAVEALAEMWVAIDRIEQFLYHGGTDDHVKLISGGANETSALQSVVDKNDSESKVNALEIKGAVFCWKGEKSFEIRVPKLTLQCGEVVGVVGPVGAGKTTLLMGILSETSCKQGSVHHLSGVAFCPQTPWIVSGSLRDNVVFGSEFDQERYDQVLGATALAQDVQGFPDGDHTELGERGLNLSGGQKARVCLARACYSRSELVVLDDVFAALDLKTAAHVRQHCLKGLLKDRAVIVTTHSATIASVCTRVFGISDGVCSELPPAVVSPSELATLTSSESRQASEATSNSTKPAELVKAEDKTEGSVSLDTYWAYGQEHLWCMMYHV